MMPSGEVVNADGFEPATRSFKPNLGSQTAPPGLYSTLGGGLFNRVVPSSDVT